jgi:hypothetical protein
MPRGLCLELSLSPAQAFTGLTASIANQLRGFMTDKIRSQDTESLE